MKEISILHERGHFNKTNKNDKLFKKIIKKHDKKSKTDISIAPKSNKKNK